MSLLSYPTRNFATRQSWASLRYLSWNRPTLLASSPAVRRRCFNHTRRKFAAEVGKERDVADNMFWKEYRASFSAQNPTFSFEDSVPISLLGSEVTASGFLTKITSLSESLCFAHINRGDLSKQVQILCQGAELCKSVRIIKLNSTISVRGELAKKRMPKGVQGEREGSEKGLLLNLVEIKAMEILCLNSIPADLQIGHDHNYPPQSRHLQIRFDVELRKRLKLRSQIASWFRSQLELEDFKEVETPVLFKSTPEGAREFLVPTRKPGYAYALPQSPQQYKQILMASGIEKYFQFAKCFRDEDLRADRQPEFTQIDLEMAFANGENVMQVVERLIKSLHKIFAGLGIAVESPLSETPFIRMTYEEAMSKHGSDKPDLRIKGSIHRIDNVVPEELRGMLTSIQDPIIEAYKLRLNSDPSEVQAFVRKFLDSPDAQPFISNVDGAPGVCVYDTRKPVQGLQTFGFEGAEELKALYAGLHRPTYQDEEIHQINTTFEDGDLLIVQARENLPHSGGSTVLGKLRLAIHKAAVAEGLVKPDLAHHYLWVTEFPMFTLNNDTDPGQGGASGFSATHHPFTAPMSAGDVDLLLIDPLKSKADHYDLVVNGVELGGGSRRIHNAEMQKFVMRDILKMSEERINDFSHLFEALRAGCPPHAGLALGFDRLVAVMTGRESVKDVIAFPKSSKGEDMMVRSPSRMTDTELSRYHLQLESPIRGEEVEQASEPSVEEKVEGTKSDPPRQA